MNLRLSYISRKQVDAVVDERNLLLDKSSSYLNTKSVQKKCRRKSAKLTSLKIVAADSENQSSDYRRNLRAGGPAEYYNPALH